LLQKDKIYTYRLTGLRSQVNRKWNTR